MTLKQGHPQRYPHQTFCHATSPCPDRKMYRAKTNRTRTPHAFRYPVCRWKGRCSQQADTPNWAMVVRE